MRIQPYSNGEIQLRIYYDHTSKKNEEAVIRVDDGQVIEELAFSFHLVE